ncbi:MAG: alpha/beta hydrolase [Christensenellaceae bacterium]|nr:alpha/beta hydrolase [Christensenellaceae bacterium]
MHQLPLQSATGQGELYVRVWEPENQPKAVLQIVHGMAEHIERYDRFARYLNQNSILVVGADNASHGKSISKDGIRGYFGAEHGWNSLIQDIQSVHSIIKQSYCGLPCILFGHSMGSFLARSYAARHGDDLDGFIFCGTAGKNPALPVAKVLARSEIRKNGASTPSRLLDKLSFGAYNNAFKPNRTPFDWLSRDEAEVDKYVDDPACGFVFTAAGFRDLFDGLGEVSGPQWARRVPKRPILLIAGDADPVGANGKGVKQVEAWLVQSGHRVKCILYPGARHELLNETNREQVSDDVRLFVEGVCGGAL